LRVINKRMESPCELSIFTHSTADHDPAAAVAAAAMAIKERE